MDIDEHFLVGPHTSVGIILIVFSDHVHVDKHQNYRNCCTSLCFILLGSIRTPSAFSVIKVKSIMNL